MSNQQFLFKRIYKKIKTSPAFKAWENMLIFSATIHVVVLLVMTIHDHNPEHLNYLSILNIDTLFPQFFIGDTRFFLAGVLLVIIYLVFLKLETKFNK